jgi:hypothetical protein
MQLKQNIIIHFIYVSNLCLVQDRKLMSIFYVDISIQFTYKINVEKHD